jgi:hypothetical protein
MPNRVAELRAQIEAAHPGAVIKHRGEAGFSMLRPDGLEEHRYTTGPWHWKAPTDVVYPVTFRLGVHCCG